MIVRDFSKSSLFKTPIITAKNISHSFDYTLFDNIDITLHEKEVVAILGVSGSGKSTLLHILSTLLKPQSGTVYYGKHSIYGLCNEQQTLIRRKNIGIIFQSHYLFKGFSVEENLTISSLLSKKGIDLELLKKLKIEHTLKQNVSDLSGGQQQRVSIARVLTKKPNIIFADEPTGNLDNETAKDVMSEMINYIKSVSGTMFVVTHDESIASMCDTVYKLKDRKINKIHVNS